MKPLSITINRREIGAEFRPYIIAEMSANHNGKIDRALETIKAAKECGADAIKIQTYTADSLTIDCDKPDFIIKGGLWDGWKLYDLYNQAHAPYEWHKELFEYAHKIGITIFSTPFDENAVNLLENLSSPAYKIASFEMIDLALIECVSRTKKPLIISTGLASREEIGETLECALKNGAKEIALLHCISAYPAPIAKANLRAIATLASEFGTVVGLSDHTLGTTAAIAACSLGAAIVEKHFKIDDNERGADSAFSIEPHELKALRNACDQAHSALGNGSFVRADVEASGMAFRRSLYFVQTVQKGEIIRAEHLRSIRPGFGLAPKLLRDLVGKTAAQTIERGTAAAFDLVIDSQ